MAPKSEYLGTNKGGWPKGKPRAGTGTGRPKGGISAEKRVVGAMARDILEDPAYLENLRRRAIDGTLNAATENLLYHYAYGKPPETVRLGSDPESPLHDPIARLKRIEILEEKMRALSNGERALSAGTNGIYCPTGSGDCVPEGEKTLALFSR